VSPRTEADEAGAVGVDLLEELRHVEVGHAERRAQQSGELLPGDPLVTVGVKQLRDKQERETDILYININIYINI